MDIEREEFERLCRMQYGLPRLGVYFGCTQKQLRRWIRDVYGRAPETVLQMLAERGRAQLLQAQFELAGKNATVALRLGELYLQQEGQASDLDGQLRALEGMVLHDGT